LHLSRTPRIIILSPPRINPTGFLTQFSLPDTLNATKGQKQNHQSVHACLHSLLSPINPLCSTTPFLPPPLFSAPFSSAALLSSSCHRYRCCWCCPHCTHSPRCCCCCCVQCLCLHQMVLLGYEQPWCVTLFCAHQLPQLLIC
jgi:hypothetical protein